MFKKLTSLLTVLSIVIGLTPMSALAAADPSLITSAAVSAQSFNPSAGQTLSVSVVFGANANLTNNSSGAYTINRVLADNQMESVHTLTSWGALAGAAPTAVPNQAIVWDGKAGCNNQPCAPGNYVFTPNVSFVDAANNDEVMTDFEDVPFTIVDTFALTKFEVTPSKVGNATMDPSTSGEDEDLKIDFAFNKVATGVNFEILDSKNVAMRSNQNFANTAGQVLNSAWDGAFGGRLVVPGTYTVKMTATFPNEPTITETRTIVVAYDSGSKPQITGFDAVPNSFDPDSDDLTVNFTNTNTAKLTLKITNVAGDTIKDFSNFTDDEFSANTVHAVSWDGTANNGAAINTGSYVAVLEARNDHGVTVNSETIQIVDTATDLRTSNAHMDNITCKPSGDFEPAVDDAMECEADTKVDNVDVEVFAVRGGVEIELYTEEDVDKGTDTITFDWDGTDEDDEYVDEGTWRIEFRTKVGATSLLSGVARKVVYDKPDVDEYILSKTKIDNDKDEVTYAIFRPEDDGEVSLFYMVDGNRDDEIVEEMEVEADKWYAVEVDADGFDYDDDLDIELVIANSANENVNTSRRVSLDLAEDEVSGSKSNVTQDTLSPVVSDCEDTLSLSYNIDDDADMLVTIHRGKTASGSTIATLQDADDVDSGDYNLDWNCRDSNGNKLSSGFYTYEVESKVSSTDIETGVFVIADSEDIGDVDGGSSSSSDDDDDNSGVGSGVVINGSGDDEDEETPEVPTVGECAGFEDVLEDDSRCDAVEWAKNMGVFEGYADGTFGIDKQINRAEFAKVILEANNVDASVMPAGNLGFSDVQVGAWYMKYLKRAMELGVMKGDDGKTTVRPADFVNRVEALKMTFELARALNGYQAQVCTPGFADTPSNTWYTKFVCESERLDLFESISGNNFLPAKAATRGEIVEMLYILDSEGLL
ncbi:S-layer homology domain-containing protein [Candidatus Gracilibacteria bacterium]|nr:S-layer homology domain-containing protein [Candidatus Gracilibacteria bacterium]